MLDCDFCAPTDSDSQSPVHHFANRIVATCGKLLVVADRAPMTVGHLLLITREHHTGFASFVARESSASANIRNYTHWYRQAFGNCTVIEHGSGNTASMAGPCIDHAHWHLLPYNNELRPIIGADYGDSMNPVTLPELARDYACSDYLFYWDADGAHVAPLDAATRFPQYARSVVARYLEPAAEPYEWDWALRADEETLIRTLATAKKALAIKSEPPDNSHPLCP